MRCVAKQERRAEVAHSSESPTLSPFPATTQQEISRREEHKHDVLQTESAALMRDFLTTMHSLEEEVDRLRLQSEQLF